MGHKRRQFITTTGEVDQEESKKQMNPDLPSSTQSESQPAGKLSRFDLSAQILTGLIVGVGCVGLLRMTVLPYISVTLIASLGRFRRSLRLNFPAMLKYFGIVAVAGIAILFAVRLILNQSIMSADNKREVIAEMQLLERPVDSIVIRQGIANPTPLRENETLLERVRRRGILRVGYNADKVPFAFFNDQQILVGYDVNMAHALARDMNVSLEFVRFDREMLADQLRQDHFDIVMSGLVGTLERSEAMQHTRSYMDVNLALVVTDYRAGQFKTLDSIRSMNRPRIGFVDLSRGFYDQLRTAIPDAELIEISNHRDFFLGNTDNLDALLISAESGSAFSLMFADYEVVIPTGLKVKLPLFYAIANQDTSMRDFLEHWIILREKDGTAQEFYDHWILGKTSQAKQPRWSVLRDVLHWID